MSKIKPVLGRGLASLIPHQERTGSPPGPAAGADDGNSVEIVASIDVQKIGRNPYQPRADFDPAALDELKRSIAEKGIIQPITVRRAADGYQLISGERRVRAARDLGMSRIPAYIIRVTSDEEMLELALIENLQREHLNPIEIAISYKRLIDECRLTQEEVSQRIGKDRTTVTNFLRLLRLPDVIQIAVRKGDVTGGHARALVAIEEPGLQMSIFHKILKRGLSVRDVERAVRLKTARSRPQRTTRAAPGSTLAGFEEQLRHFLGTKVRISSKRDGKGEIVIEYYSNNDLDRLLEIFTDLQDRSR
jgi:ParB family chromosome partitioning protein